MQSKQLAPLLAILLVQFTGHLVLADTSAPVIRNDIAAINLQTSAPSYSIGQAVLIRVGIKNISTEAYAFNNGSPWLIAVLLVKDEAGNRVAPVAERDSTSPFSAQGYSPRVVQPGQTMWLFWESNDWSEISHWGFKLGPGTYTISAIPCVAGFPTSSLNQEAGPIQGCDRPNHRELKHRDDSNNQITPELRRARCTCGRACLCGSCRPD